MQPNVIYPFSEINNYVANRYDWSISFGHKTQIITNFMADLSLMDFRSDDNGRKNFRHYFIALSQKLLQANMEEIVSNLVDRINDSNSYASKFTSNYVINVSDVLNEKDPIVQAWLVSVLTLALEKNPKGFLSLIFPEYHHHDDRVSAAKDFIAKNKSSTAEKWMQSSSAQGDAADVKKIKTLIDTLQELFFGEKTDGGNFKETVAKYNGQIENNSQLRFEDFSRALVDAIICDACFSDSPQDYILHLRLNFNSVTSSMIELRTGEQNEACSSFEETMDNMLEKIGKPFEFKSDKGVAKLEGTVNVASDRLRSGVKIDLQAYQNSLQAAIYVILFDKEITDKKGALVKLWKNDIIKYCQPYSRSSSHMLAHATSGIAAKIDSYDELKKVLLSVMEDEVLAKKLGYNFTDDEINNLKKQLEVQEGERTKTVTAASEDFNKDPIGYLSNTASDELVKLIKAGAFSQFDFYELITPSITGASTNKSVAPSSSSTTTVMTNLGGSMSQTVSKFAKKIVAITAKIANSNEPSVKDFINRLYNEIYNAITKSSVNILDLDGATLVALIKYKGGNILDLGVTRMRGKIIGSDFTLEQTKNLLNKIFTVLGDKYDMEKDGSINVFVMEVLNQYLVPSSQIDASAIVNKDKIWDIYKGAERQMQSLRDHPISFLADILQNPDKTKAETDFTWALDAIKRFNIPLNFTTTDTSHMLSDADNSKTTLYNLNNIIRIIDKFKQLEELAEEKRSKQYKEVGLSGEPRLKVELSSKQLRLSVQQLNSYAPEFKDNLVKAIEAYGSEIIDVMERISYEDFNKIMDLIAIQRESILSDFAVLLYELNDDKQYNLFDDLFINRTPDEHVTKLRSALVKFSVLKETEENKQGLPHKEGLAADLCGRNEEFKREYEALKEKQSNKASTATSSSSSTKGGGDHQAPGGTSTGGTTPSSPESDQRPVSTHLRRVIVDDILGTDSDIADDEPTEA